MKSGKRLVDELCNVVRSFLCQPGTGIDLWQCSAGPHVFAKGSTQPICIVKLVHEQTYYLEFVYKYWCHLLKAEKFPFSPVFIICNNGLAVTLKCFLCEPRDTQPQFGQCLRMDSDVYLAKNAYVVLSQDDFTKFKTNLVFSKDLSVYNSMVVCRTYLTDFRQAIQFLVVKARNPKRVSVILGMISETLGLSNSPGHSKEKMFDDLLCKEMNRRPIKQCQTRDNLVQNENVREGYLLTENLQCDSLGWMPWLKSLWKRHTTVLVVGGLILLKLAALKFLW
nr:nuclear egress membrane protein [Macronycteris gammaherpesvirus 1]